MTPVIALLLAGADAAQHEPCTAPQVVTPGSVDAALCEGAIEGAPSGKEKARYLFQRAFLRNDKGDPIGALADLDLAIAADSDNVAVRQERAYTRNELGDYAGAAADLDLLVARGSATAQTYAERAFARSRSADFAGALADRDRVLAMTPDDAGAHIARASDLVWQGRYDAALAALDRADASAAAAGDAKIKQQSGTMRVRISTLTGRTAADPDAACRASDKPATINDHEALPGILANCSAAFLAAKTPRAKAELLTIRSIAWSMIPDDANATLDRQIAVALDPGNADWHVNLGSIYVAREYSWAGEREFDRALAIKETWLARAGRASARYNLHNAAGAFSDAKRSFEMHPNILALTVLGDLANDRHDDKSARLYWMGAYQLGDRDDGLIARLRGVGITDPAHPPNESNAA